MTDDLLDEATRLAEDFDEWRPGEDTGRVLRALVERVQQAEDRLDSAADAYDSWRNHALDARSDLFEARGKIDKVREACKAVRSQGDLEVLDVRVLAILDGKAG